MSENWPGSGVLCAWFGGIESSEAAVSSHSTLFPWNKVSIRLQKRFSFGRPRTLDDMLNLGRKTVSRIRGLGGVTLGELDEIMESNGLTERWYGS